MENMCICDWENSDWGNHSITNHFIIILQQKKQFLDVYLMENDYFKILVSMFKKICIFV